MNSTDVKVAAQTIDGYIAMFPKGVQSQLQQARRTIALPSLVYAMDMTVLNVAIPAISTELKPTSTQLL